MERRAQYVARFMVHKVGSFVVKERVLCFSENGFSTFDPDTQLITNTWTYDEVEKSSTLEGETDFVVITPSHRIKKTVYRCHYRMEVLVCLMRLRSQYQARIPQPIRPELQTYSFPSLKYHTHGVQTYCLIDICPDGVYQRDQEGEILSHIPCTSFVSIDLISDHQNAIVLNHSDNSSLFIVEKRTEMAQAIHRVMRAYGMEINEYRKKTMQMACQEEKKDYAISFQYPIRKVLTDQTISSRLLSVSEKYIAEYMDHDILISSRPLSRVYSLIVLEDASDGLEIVYVDGVRRLFYSNDREKLVCEILASCHALNNAQVDVKINRIHESIRMVPQKIIQQEGIKSVRQGMTNDNVMDRELRVVQSCCLQQLTRHGAAKTARGQRRLPSRLDEEMYALALELNANTPTAGIYGQPNKPYDKVVFYIAREIRDVVNRHGPCHAYLVTYLQSLYRLLYLPSALKEFMNILNDSSDEYVSTIAEILVGRHSVVVYWMFMVLSRLIDAKGYKMQCREVLLSHHVFLMSLLSLFDADTKTLTYLSDLPTMTLCQFTLGLVKLNPERHQKLSMKLYEQLARKLHMIHRIFLSFPGLATVEACVGILSRMTNNPTSLYFNGGEMNMDDSSQATQSPPLSLNIDEHVLYEQSDDVKRSTHSSNHLSRHRSIRPVGRAPPSSSGIIATNTFTTHGVGILNPAILLRQYRLLLETPCGIHKQLITQNEDTICLRLRYRYRHVFLQELMNHFIGSINDFKRVFMIQYSQYSGYIGKMNGVREKSEFYITPRALIVVRVTNQSTQEFEFRRIQQLYQAKEPSDAFAMTINNKLRYIYTDSCIAMILHMRQMAGVIGIRLNCINGEQLPKRTQQPQVSMSAVANQNLIEVSKRGGWNQFRKKKIMVFHGSLIEMDPESGKEKNYSLQDLQRVVVPKLSMTSNESLLISLDFVDGTRITYQSDHVQMLLGKLYDGCNYTGNRGVAISPGFARVNPRLTTRALLQEENEKRMYLGQDNGLFLYVQAELVKALEKLKSGTAGTIVITMEKALFAFENANLNVEWNKPIDPRIDLKPVLQGLVIALEQSCTLPMRVDAVTIILETFCRVNQGCYRFVLDSDEESLEMMQTLVRLWMRILTHSKNPFAILWAIRAVHASIVDQSRVAVTKMTERLVRSNVLEKNDQLIHTLLQILEQDLPICSLAVLELLSDILIRTRVHTDNNHFDAIIRALSGHYALLLQLTVQTSVVGLAVTATCLLKIMLEHTNTKTRQRICDTALDTGLTLQALEHAFFHPTEAGRETYRYIASMWIVHHRPSYQLLTRMLPHGLIRMISNPVTRKLLQQLKEKETKFNEKKKQNSQGVRDNSEWFIRRMRQEISSTLPRTIKAKDDRTRCNYPGESGNDLALLSEVVLQDFELPDLIWNEDTRVELRNAFKSCMKGKDVNLLFTNTIPQWNPKISWNHKQFEVVYKTLEHEPLVATYYLRVLLSRLSDGTLKLKEAVRLVESLGTGAKQLKPNTETSETSHLLHSVLDLASMPEAFFCEVYQRWLEFLHFPEQECVYQTKKIRTSFIERVGTHGNRESDAESTLLVKIMIELVKGFPSVRLVPFQRIQFLIEIVKKSFAASEIEQTVELLSIISQEPSVIRYFAPENSLSIFTSLTALCQRQPQRQVYLGGIESEDDMPVLHGGVLENVSSVPELSGSDRLTLQWCVRLLNDEACAGPFTAVELKQYIIQQSSFAVHDVVACCCSIHEKHDSLVHEWHRFHEVPELRWMELLDEPIEAARVGYHALSILHNIVRNEPPATTKDGALVVPVPLGKQLLSHKPRLEVVTQLLLVDNPVIRTTACDILLSLGPTVAPQLYECGLYFFLFSIEDDSTLFVEQSRLLQNCEKFSSGKNYLLDMLPEPLINVLHTDSAEYFAEIFTGRTIDKRVLWTVSMRHHLRMAIVEHLEELYVDLRRNVASTYRYVSLPPIRYMELSHDVYCGGYFLSTIANDDSDLDGIEDPQVLMHAIDDKWNSLVHRQSLGMAGMDQDSITAFNIFGWSSDNTFTAKELRGRYRDLCNKGTEVSIVRAAYEVLCELLERKDEVDKGHTSDGVIYCILKSKLRLLETFSFQMFSYESTTLHLLLSLIAHRPQRISDTNISQAKDPIDLRGISVRILHRLLIAAPSNVDKLLQVDRMWDILLGMIDAYIPSLDVIGKETAFAILEVVASSEHGPSSLLDTMSDMGCGEPNSFNRSSLFSEEGFDGTAYFTNSTSSVKQHRATTQCYRLCAMLDNLTATEQPSSLQILLFRIVGSLCRHTDLRNYLLLSTKIFWRVLYLLLHFNTKSHSEEGEEHSGIVQKKQDVLEAAFMALRSLAIISDHEQVDGRSQGWDALVSLLPISSLDCLFEANASGFWEILATDIREPCCIWNEGTRHELIQLIVDHCSSVDNDELTFMESVTHHMYDCLEEEPRVGGIYLHVVLEKVEQGRFQEESLYPHTAIDVIEALFHFLDENRDPSIGIYAETLPALECLCTLIDFPVFASALVQALEIYADEHDAVVSIVTLARYLLPFDSSDSRGMKSISSRRSLSTYGFSATEQMEDLDGLPEGMEAEFGNVDYLNRQEFSLLIINKMCGFDCSLEKMFTPFCRFTWSLQVIADHLDYGQAYCALCCLAELCDTCFVIAEYVEQSGLWVEILGMAIQSRQYVLHEHFLCATALREPAFDVLYALLSKDSQAIRDRMYSGLCHFLPYPIVYQIHLNPRDATKFFDDNHHKGDLIWDAHTRTEVRRKVDIVIRRNRIERSRIHRDSVLFDEDDYIQMPDTFIAGLYLEQFLKDPDPEQLTNPAYNLESLFIVWNEKLNGLMGFDLENPPEFLKELGDEVENLTTAMVYILEANVEIIESIEAAQIPEDVVRLVRHCNKHMIAGFPYRCVLRLARRLTQCPAFQTRDFFEMLFGRITINHPDIPALARLLRRSLESRAQFLQNATYPRGFVLADLRYYSAMLKFLESIVEKKEQVDAKVLSNVHRILRLIQEELHTETRDLDPSPQSFFQRASARWNNLTLNETQIASDIDIDEIRSERNEDETASNQSFDVDLEYEPFHPRDRFNNTFNVDEERELDKLPPRSLMFDGERVQEMAPPPVSFRFINRQLDYDNERVVRRDSMIRATYEPVDNQYHSTKATEYKNLNDIEQGARNHNQDTIASPLNHRLSLLESWRSPTSTKPNRLLAAMTVSRRGRRSASIYSKRKAFAPKRWFGR